MRTVERGGGRRGAAANTPLPVAAISSQTPCKRARELSGKELADIAQFSRRWVATWAGRVYDWLRAREVAERSAGDQ